MHLENDTFKNMTALSELDLRYNYISWCSNQINIFSDLIGLKILKLSGSLHNSETLCPFIASPPNVQELHIENDILDNTLIFAAKFPDVKTLKIFCNLLFQTVIDLSENRTIVLCSLSKLEALSLIKCNIKDIVPHAFKHMRYLETLNLACNKFEFPSVIRKLGGEDGLSNLQTLVLDKNFHSRQIADFSTFKFSNLSFSRNLRRISVQGIGLIIYSPMLWLGAPNLTSIACGQNLLMYGTPYSGNPVIYLIALQHVKHLKLSFLNDYNPSLHYSICEMPDTTLDDIFEDKTASTTTTPNFDCTISPSYVEDLQKCFNISRKSGKQPIALPYCLQTLNLNQLVYSRWKDDKKNGKYHICSNKLEEL